ncbi:putative bifunctional diguanylate cyclase/phosphodiesterase [Sphingomonas sp. ACRSK]|uniref:putative bifunctional diguanylate cyclase/phosphodiesterase n=1 Tax=Sphingomonas sp. ACRSK TaxID=2918213 RepID=UPI001EF694C4|nr:bifunctional diguanylate cyclase/phosphodiesterase [Sphingomonas sp. ACRSK]MCG7347420.1 bifunctional diguanylate cyclase/phosphodiesterase [Sphingomonas sp. ACRSK]
MSRSLATEPFLDVLPMPAAVATLRDGKVTLSRINSGFRQIDAEAGPKGALDCSDMRARIHRFLEGDALRDVFEWTLGQAVDARYYRVVLTRRSGARARRCLLSLIDRTPEERTEHSLRREMAIDALTGLPNRAGFEDRLEEVLANGGREQYAVLALNLDRFSRINACLGGIVGDELLISVARRLKGALRQPDVLARTGGDEFAILLSGVSRSDDATEVAERIRGALAIPFTLSDFEVRIGCSIGIALGASLAADHENMVRHAQFAAKRAKRTGLPEVYRSEALDVMRAEFSIETELRRAIDSGNLHLHYQPICDLATGRIVSFEALARWRTEAGEDIPPARFIPVAEEAGLIVPMGRWALDEAMRTLAGWDRVSGASCGLTVAVNLSAVQLRRDNVVALVERTLAAHNLAPRRLTIELTESAIVSDRDPTAETLRALKALGTTIAMDDFGTGYSNLGYLQSLPIDLLKIDRSFVSGMLANRDKVAIVRAVLSLAQTLGMRTTAEGIETEALEQTLGALGCDYGQGYLYARPVDAERAYQLLLERNR